ncbi:dTDP-4-dehydrorhamnose reductase [Sinomonas sp. R1AF57]|nr:dTDP-4-dehydrorhamnose reductase [Sinomonas sp. R1AF57]
MEFSKPLTVQGTAIPGLLLLDLPVHGDGRGWFKENWQRQKMTGLGLPDFGPVQNNISFNATAGTTRGIHAEPWDKYVSVATGRIFGAWVDLREGPTFGAVVTAELDPSRAVFVPRGVGNAFQTLQDGTAYTYLVNDHWSAEVQGEYTFLNLADETVAIPWPIPLADAELSEKDRAHPRLAQVAPMRPRTVLVLGANGQLGRALRDAYGADDSPAAVEFATRSEFDLADPGAYASRDWSQYGAVVNAAAYTAVDKAETPEGRREAWAVNAGAVAKLARVAAEHRITLVNVSSDYVFDGTIAVHSEDEPFSPLGVYGQSKAAGDAAVAAVPRHYTVRTSWVIGDGNNFVRTMARLAAQGVSPAVVDDQMGRPTFTQDLAAGIRHLLDTQAPYGTYNLSCSGETASWADVAAEVFAVAGRHPGDIQRTTTAAYFADRPHTAPRPLNSTLDLHRIESTGFTPQRWEDRLRTYLGADDQGRITQSR